MAKKRLELEKSLAELKQEGFVEIVYIGPDRCESPVFGRLVVGTRYQAEAAFGTYLLERHPEFWQRPEPGE